MRSRWDLANDSRARFNLNGTLAMLYSALGEYPFWYHFAGIALIFGGIALSRVGEG